MSKFTNFTGFMCVAGLLAIAGSVNQAQAAIFSFGAAEASPTQHTDFSRSGDTGTLTSDTSVEFEVNIGGTSVEVDDVDFVLDAAIDSVVDLAGGLEQVFFSGDMSFTTSGGELIISATFIGGRMFLGPSGGPLSGLRAEDDGSTAVIDEADYIVGDGFRDIAGAIVGFDPDDPNVLVDLIAPEDLEFTLTNIIFTDDGFTANGSYSGNAELSVIIVPEPRAVMMALAGIAIMAIRRRTRKIDPAG